MRDRAETVGEGEGGAVEGFEGLVVGLGGVECVGCVKGVGSCGCVFW